MTGSNFAWLNLRRVFGIIVGLMGFLTSKRDCSVKDWNAGAEQL